MNWIELNWIELNWIELNWIELNWIELNWIELNWIELNWIELKWIELNWIELNWIELNWIRIEFFAFTFSLSELKSFSLRRLLHFSSPPSWSLACCAPRQVEAVEAFPPAIFARRPNSKELLVSSLSFSKSSASQLLSYLIKEIWWNHVFNQRKSLKDHCSYHEILFIYILSLRNIYSICPPVCKNNRQEGTWRQIESLEDRHGTSWSCHRSFRPGVGWAWSPASETQREISSSDISIFTKRILFVNLNKSTKSINKNIKN